MFDEKLFSKEELINLLEYLAEKGLLGTEKKSRYKVAKAKGGGFFQKPELEIYEKNLFLEPVDLEKFISENLRVLQPLVNSTLDFILDVFEKHKDRVCVVGFSGGKDSTVLLDLVQRVLTPFDFFVIFNDTSMELSSTYDFWATEKIITQILSLSLQN